MRSTNPLFNRQRHRGSSLIDVAAGAAVLSLILIPAMQMMGKSNSRLSDLALKDALIFEAERAIHTSMITLSDPAGFRRARALIDQPVRDNGSKQFRTRIEHIQDPQIVDLLTIRCTAYQDTNSNGRLDIDETQQVLQTQWCRP